MNVTSKPSINRVLVSAVALILWMAAPMLHAQNVTNPAPGTPSLTPGDSSSTTSPSRLLPGSADGSSATPMENRQGVNVNVNLQNQSNQGMPGQAIDPEAEEEKIPLSDRVFLHGFRMGYNLITEFNTSRLNRYGLQSPHQFVIGYEFMQRIIGHDWLNLILVQNVLVGGLEQSAFIPTANLIFGFELANSFQLGFGVNLTLDPDGWSHMIIVAGYTPKIGDIYMPIQVHFVPDVNGQHRLGASLGFTL